ncbi:MAG: hypothetical protein RRC34_06625 [Lentisphaeria bacterium]|nr:hypothetical protein [Lentisphaeria bacterium]
MMTAERKANYSVFDIKQAFPDYGMSHSDDPSPVRAAIMLPRAMLGTVNLEEGVFETSVTACFGNDKPCQYSSEEEEKARRCIVEDLLPQWRAAGFDPTGEEGFESEDESGLDAEYSFSMRKSVPTLADLEKTIKWIVDEAETNVCV